MAFRLETTTRDGLTKVVAETLTSNPFTRKMLMKPELWNGNRHKVPVKVLSNTNYVAFKGLATLATSTTDTVRNMEYVHTNASMNVALPLDEVDVNSSADKSTAVTDLLKLKLQEAGLDFAEHLGTVFYGNGTGDDFNGLGNLVDDGTVSTTIGGLSRVTFPVLNSVVTATGGTLTLDKMVTLYNQIADSGIQPNLVVAGKTVNSLYEKIAQTLNQYLNLAPNQTKFNAGATATSFKGIPVLIDAKATAQTMFILNTDYLKWVMVKSKFNKAVELYPEEFDGGVPDPDVKGLGFSWRGWIDSYDQYAVNTHLILSGNLICTAPNRQGKLTGITTA